MTKLTLQQETEKKRYLAKRVRNVKRMLKLFYSGSPKVSETENCQTAASDCITDLMHLATAQGWSYWWAHENALMHHNAEQSGGEHG